MIALCLLPRSIACDHRVIAPQTPAAVVASLVRSTRLPFTIGRSLLPRQSPSLPAQQPSQVHKSTSNVLLLLLVIDWSITLSSDRSRVVVVDSFPRCLSGLEPHPHRCGRPGVLGCDAPLHYSARRWSCRGRRCLRADQRRDRRRGQHKPREQVH